MLSLQGAIFIHLTNPFIDIGVDIQNLFSHQIMVIKPKKINTNWSVHTLWFFGRIFLLK